MPNHVRNRIIGLIGGAMEDAVYDSDIQRELADYQSCTRIISTVDDIYQLLDISTALSDEVANYPHYVTIGDLFMEEAENIRLAINFSCFDVASSSDNNGFYPIAGTLYSDDIEFDDDALFEMRNIRERIMQAALQSV